MTWDQLRSLPSYRGLSRWSLPISPSFRGQQLRAPLPFRPGTARSVAASAVPGCLRKLPLKRFGSPAFLEIIGGEHASDLTLNFQSRN